MAPKPKSKSRTRSAKPKPGFACKTYPRCPRRIEVELRETEPGDEEENLPPMYRSCSTEVKGPCREKCHKRAMEEPINHSVLLLTPYGAIDIGS